MIKKLMTSLFIGLLLAFSFQAVMPAVSNAAVASGCKNDTFFGFPTWYEYLEVGPNDTGDPCAINGPREQLEGKDRFSFRLALPRIGLAVIEILLRVSGLVGIGYIIFGGFKYMTSQGEPDATKKAQSTVINALIGVALSILATTIVVFVGQTLWK